MTLTATSDQQPRPNIRTADEWLEAVIHSGQVTRIAQHLALVLYHLADPSTGATKRSVRELEQITGWSRETIADRLSELEVFMRVTLGKGRAKTEFELQCAITETVKGWKKTAVVVGVPDATPPHDETLAVDEADAKAAAGNIIPFPKLIPSADLASQLDAIVDANSDATVASATPAAKTDANPDTNIAAKQAVAKPDATADANVVVDEADTTSIVVASQPDAKLPSRARPRANMESPTEILSSKLASLPRDDDAHEHDEGLNGAAAPMLDDIVGWMNAGDTASARKWLGALVSHHGQDIVKQSYLKLKTDMLEGAMISRPLQVWGQIATRMRNEPPKASTTQKKQDDVAAMKQAFRAARKQKEIGRE